MVLNGLIGITDDPTSKLCCKNRGLEVIELCRCNALTITSIEIIIRKLHCLKKLNINMIPKIKLETIIETIEQKPNLQILQFGTKYSDVRDNGLRVPLPPVRKEAPPKKPSKGKK